MMGRRVKKSTLLDQAAQLIGESYCRDLAERSSRSSLLPALRADSLERLAEFEEEMRRSGYKPPARS